MLKYTEQRAVCLQILEGRGLGGGFGRQNKLLTFVLFTFL
ncbi:hypothetical protein TREPR_3231 [Treponema primitia ZAS-2]|uniref:Uncharacterized protein n=1 Tax=Treponema primitia (strain ATCC BAA-887 / DSM 12427 / ZAS-2) TaxID=545694 RepID=F5YKY4_TREPZ|nr:hypothetical protein TREPR_3231 [Treponema primitia ZAS-2]